MPVLKLAAESTGESNIDPRNDLLVQQRFGALETLRAVVSVRRLTRGGLNARAKWEPAQATRPCQLIYRKIAFQVSL